MVGIRRENARSSDSGYGSGKLMHITASFYFDLLTQSTLDPMRHPTIEQWVAQKDPYRVVAHGLPMTYSLMARRCDSEIDEFFKTQVQHLVPGVLNQHHISFSIMQFDYWYPRRKESEGQNTLVVYTRDINTGSWSAAAKTILCLFNTGEAEDISKSVQVEIRNRNRMYNDYSRPLPNDDNLVDELEQISGKISSIVHTLMRGSWSSISYHDRINRQAEDDTASKTTVIVFCRPGASCDYETAENEIMKILDTASHRIHVEFLPGEILLLPEFIKKGMNLYPLPLKPLNGSSLGIAGNRDKAGTLGGWMFLNLPNQEQQMKCALTCYHVVRSDDKTAASHTDTQGVLLNDPRGHVMVTYPASLDTDHMTALMKKTPSTPEKAETQGVLSSLIANPDIGKVVLASGHRVHDQHRLDWALIESPSTFSANKPPPKAAFLHRPMGLPETGDYSLNSDSKVRQFGRVRKDDWVVKRGRTSGVTSAKINRMRREIEWTEHKKVTFETEIISLTEDFAAPGDSGSVVTNENGELVGLLFSMADEPARHDIGFMTPITAIQDDVKRLTGGGFVSLD